MIEPVIGIGAFDAAMFVVALGALALVIDLALAVRQLTRLRRAAGASTVVERRPAPRAAREVRRQTSGFGE